MLSEDAARKPTVDGLNQVVKITIDGMDQAKFKTPRNLASSKEWDKLWRPQLHVVGCIVHGHLETYWIMGPEVRKDANMNCTIILKTLGMVTTDLACRGASLPQTLVTEHDNTASEGKNQFHQSLQAYLVGEKVFENTQVECGEVGHTHNCQDQRFSSVARTLSRAPVLETPTQFKVSSVKGLHNFRFKGANHFQTLIDLVLPFLSHFLSVP